MEKIAIVTVDYNGHQDTLDLLQSAREIACNGFEVKWFLVDNGSDTPLEDCKPQKIIKNLEVLQIGENKGFAGGYNHGIKYAFRWGADYLLIINNDTLFKDKEILRRLLGVLRKDKKIALISPKILFAAGFEFQKDWYKKSEVGKIIWWAGAQMDWANVKLVHRGLDQVDNGQFDEIKETEFVSGCCFLIKKEALERVGVFNDKFFAYFEDVELMMRLKKLDYKLYYHGGTSIYHKVSRTSGIGSPITDYLITRNRLYFGMSYASFRTKLALAREALRFLVFGRAAQKKGTLDFLRFKFGPPDDLRNKNKAIRYPLELSIVIDARMYGLEHAGIGRYVMNLVHQLEREDKKNHYFLFLRKKYYRNLDFKNPRFKKILVEISHYSFKEQLLLPGILKKIKPDLVHFPHFNVPIFWQGKYIVTIHDLIKHQSKGTETTTRLPFLYWPKYVFYRLIVFLAIKRAKKIITPSNWWKKELIKRYNLKPNKITVTYEGADEFLNKKLTKGPKLLKEYSITKPFVIYTGNLYPHKNVLRLVKAIALLNQTNKKQLSLVIACARDIFMERFKKEIENIKRDIQVVLAGFVPTEDLIALYQEAEAFVTPSLLEGFGLPGLEAMSSGTPVIASKASCLPEIYGEAAVYFNPLNVNDIAKKIKELVGNEKKRQVLIQKGFEQVKKYSWQKMAKETLKVYQKI